MQNETGLKMSKWFKSSYSGPAGHCVEVKFNPNSVEVKHSKTEDAPHIYTLEEWSAFVKGAKNGEFDLP